MSEGGAGGFVSSVPVLGGITCRWIETRRLRTRVLVRPSEGLGDPVVLFLHGNASSATWWEETLLALPSNFYGIAPDMRGYGDSDPAAKVRADQGMQDFAEDAIALLDYLEVKKAHIVGHSLGGLVTYHLMREHPDRISSVTLIAPGSPFGFGATKDLEGTPSNPDFAGSGGGLVNPLFIERLKSKDTSTESPFSPLAVMRKAIFRPGFVPPNEHNLLLSLLTTHIGPQDYPGDCTTSTHWPFVAPGTWGAINATSPKYMGDNGLIIGRIFVPVLWVRGVGDVTVADGAGTDMAYLGKLGLVPGYPGEEVCPPQPMIGQIQHFLEKYAKSGAKVYPIVFEDCGHTPHLEKLDQFNSIFHQFLRGSLQI